MNEQNNYVLIGFDDSFERHCVIWEGQCVHTQSAWEQIQLAIETDAYNYKQYDGQKVTLVCLDTEAVTSTAYINVVTKIELEW